jgi:hypothetical protein
LSFGIFRDLLLQDLFVVGIFYANPASALEEFELRQNLRPLDT